MPRFRPYMVKNAAWLCWVNGVAASVAVPPALRAVLYRRAAIAVGPGSRILPRQHVVRGPLTIGAGCYVNAGGHLDPGRAGITIEDAVYLGPGVVLAASSHELGPHDGRAGVPTSAPITIGAGSWLGAGVVVLPGVTIGRGCVIAAGAVVRADTEDDGLYAGVPARRVRDLDPASAS